MHGRLKPAARRELMASFKARELDVLVATTVIEVGVDVPNATIMIVQEADRFGLAQLHQLRGRVGRGAEQSYCLLISRAKEELTESARDRLEALVESTDGFELAERDLEIRGGGQLLGARQSGLSDLRFARITKDIALLEAARDAARALPPETMAVEVDALLGGAEHLGRVLGHELERLDVPGPDDREVAAVERRDRRDAEPFGCRDDRGIDGAEREVAVLLDEVRDPEPIGWMNRLDGEIPESQLRQEPKLDVRMQPRGHEVRHLGDREYGHSLGAGELVQQRGASLVLSVVLRSATAKSGPASTTSAVDRSIPRRGSPRCAKRCSRRRSLPRLRRGTVAARPAPRSHRARALRESPRRACHSAGLRYVAALCQVPR